AGEEDLLCRIEAFNRGPEAAPLHLLPHIWFRNTWSWGYASERPRLEAVGPATVGVWHRHLGERRWAVRGSDGHPVALLFPENDSNAERLWAVPNPSPYVKDAFHAAVVDGLPGRV